MKRFLASMIDSAGLDGASSPVGPLASADHDDIELLMKAWSLERGSRIEAELLLDEGIQLLRKILIHGTLTDAHRRKLKLFVRHASHAK